VGAGTFTDHVTIDPSITGLTIEGAGMKATTITGGFDQSGSVFTIQSGVRAEIDDLGITGGTAPNGGGVNNAGSLTMQRDFVSSNAAIGTAATNTGYGGGVFYTGPLTILDSAITFNRASNAGGGIGATPGSVTAFETLTRDTIDRNSVLGSDRDDGGVGGGLESSGGTVTDSTITGNRVGDASGNPAGLGGGAATVAFGPGILFRSDTIAGNVAAQGGGLYLLFIKVQGSIIAGNRGDNCGPAILAGYANDLGYNIDDNASESCGGRAPGDVFGVDPQLGQLADNGGPVQTMAIPSSSSAYDSNPNCAGTDARGVPFLQRGATRCDIGAYQVQAPSTYVANPAAGSVTAYAAGASGNVAPVLSLAGPATGLSQPTGVVVDDTGHVFVSNPTANTIIEHAPEVTGNVAPVATIAGTRTLLSKPTGLTLDGSGTLFVANAASVTEYAAGAAGNVAPIARISGSLTRLSRPRGLVIDQNGNLRVTNGDGTIETFAPHANGNVAPTSRITPGTPRTLTSPQALNVDGAGDLLVADAGASRVATFGGGASGAATPLSLLTGGMTRPTGLDLDVFGNVFVTDSAANTIDEFAAGSTGSASPIARIGGSLTGLVGPAFLSELPPPPAPRVRVSTRGLDSRRLLLRDGIALGVRASGRLAFRAERLTVSAVARVRRQSWATAKALPLRPGTLTLHLVTTRAAAHLLGRHHRTGITVIVTIRGGFGSQRRRLTVTCSG
jgi:hypothetical protein